LLALQWPDAALPRRITDGRSPRRYLISPVLVKQKCLRADAPFSRPLRFGLLRGSNGPAAGRTLPGSGAADHMARGMAVAAAARRPSLR